MQSVKMMVFWEIVSASGTDRIAADIKLNIAEVISLWLCRIHPGERLYAMDISSIKRYDDSGIGSFVIGAEDIKPELEPEVELPIVKG